MIGFGESCPQQALNIRGSCCQWCSKDGPLSSQFKVCNLEPETLWHNCLAFLLFFCSTSSFELSCIDQNNLLFAEQFEFWNVFVPDVWLLQHCCVGLSLKQSLCGAGKEGSWWRYQSNRLVFVFSLIDTRKSFLEISYWNVSVRY